MGSLIEAGPDSSGAGYRLVYVSKSGEETITVGEAIGTALTTDDIVFLAGDLGSGKTTLVSGICRGAGMEPGVQVRSPTFTLINEYPAKIPIRHADLYRVDSYEDYSTIGLFDPFFRGITLVEWGEKIDHIQKIVPTIVVKLLEMGDLERRITIECDGRRGEDVKRSLSI